MLLGEPLDGAGKRLSGNVGTLSASAHEQKVTKQ